MARSQILAKMARKDIDLEKSLKLLILFSEKLGLDEFRTWATYELIGYPKTVTLPEYRVLKAGRIIYSGVNGSSIVENVPLPLNIFPSEIRNCLNQNHVTNNLKDIIKFSNETNSYIEKDLTLLAYEVYNLSGIRAEEIKMEFEYIDFINVVAHIKSNLLDKLIFIEREYGSLDALYIQIAREQDAKKEVSGIREILE